MPQYLTFCILFIGANNNNNNPAEQKRLPANEIDLKIIADYEQKKENENKRREEALKKLKTEKNNNKNSNANFFSSSNGPTLRFDISSYCLIFFGFILF